MSQVVAKPVASRGERRQFLEYPWRHYQGDPNWIPPLRKVQKETVGYAHHPFYEHAEVQTFLAWRGSQPCGRIAAILNHAHNRQQNERRGFFGFFECIDDVDVAHALFSAVRDWFAQREIFLLRGPANPSLNYECGLLVEGFDSPPTFMMSYNPPYYERLIESWGYRKSQDLYAYTAWADDAKTIDPKIVFLAGAAKERLGITLRSLDKKHFQLEMERFLDVYNRSLPGTWGYAPMSDAEVRHMAANLKHLLVPELVVVAEVDGKVVGSTLGIPDYNPRIKQIDGRLFPFGFLRLLWNRRAIKRVRLVSTNVVPEYQKWGVGLVLMDGLLPLALKYGMQEAEFSWVLESNTLSRGTLERGGIKRTKVFRLYDYEPALPDAPSATTGGSASQS